MRENRALALLTIEVTLPGPWKRDVRCPWPDGGGRLFRRTSSAAARGAKLPNPRRSLACPRAVGAPGRRGERSPRTPLRHLRQTSTRKSRPQKEPLCSNPVLATQERSANSAKESVEPERVVSKMRGRTTQPALSYAEEEKNSSNKGRVAVRRVRSLRLYAAPSAGAAATSAGPSASTCRGLVALDGAPGRGGRRGGGALPGRDGVGPSTSVR